MMDSEEVGSGGRGLHFAEENSYSHATCRLSKAPPKLEDSEYTEASQKQLMHCDTFQHHHMSLR